jgi:tetratricopeptide (TPR) repeat protein
VRPETDRSKVTVREVNGGAAAYAVNLDAAQAPYGAAAITAAAQATGVRAYVSEAVVDGQKWYRLRAGPFVSESDARRVLSTARSQYPKAWLAVADDSTMSKPGLPDAVGSVAGTKAPGNTTLTQQDLDQTMKRAQEAFRRKDYAVAIPLLTRLTEQPEFPQRAQAQELLGLARERQGQLAHAKAEYEEYLRRYPDGEAADRVSKRLRALTFAASPASAQARAAAANESRWKVYGGVSQTYRRDTSSFDNGSVSRQATTQDAILSDVALAARRSGERYDFAARVSGAYGLDMLQDGPGSQATVSLMFGELRDRVLDWTVRGGRQSGTLGGLIGTFDGLYAGYQVVPSVRVNAMYGYPVDSIRASPSTDRKFYALSADFGTFADAWDVSLYGISQDYYGLTDRQAIGTELRYFRPGLTFVGLVDYDLHFGDLNDVLLLATAALPARWTMSANLDHRKSPGLSLQNALIGQPVRTFDELFGLYSSAQVEQFARDRSAASDTYTVSLSRPFGEHWQWSMDVSGISTGATPASGGVEATLPSGTDLIVSTQTLAYGLFDRGDVSSLGLQYQTGDATDTISLGLYTQQPLGQAWRISPRFRFDRRKFHADGSQQMLYSPGLRTELHWRRLWLEFEGGAEFGQRTLGDSSSDATRYYFSLGYRYDL